MTNQAAQTMPELPDPAFVTPDDNLYTVHQMRAMYRQGYAAALSQTAGVADGWKLVPVELTEEMVRAAHELLLHSIPPDSESPYGPTTSADAIYRAQYVAMLSVSPSMLSEDGRTVEDDVRDYGAGYALDGKRVDPFRITILAAAPAASGGDRAPLSERLYRGPAHDPSDRERGTEPQSTPEPMPPAGAPVSERARELRERAEAHGGGVFVSIGDIRVIEQALTQQRGEPVARVIFTNRKKPDVEWLTDTVKRDTLLYTTPQPSADAVREVPDGMEELREKIEALQEFKPWAHKHTDSRKGFVTSMRKAKSPEEGEEYGWVNKGTILALLSAASGEKGVGGA